MSVETIDSSNNWHIEARKILKDQRVKVDTSTYLMFAEAYSGVDISFSKELATKAIERAERKYELAESLGYLASIEMYLEGKVNPSKGRDTFHRSLMEARAAEAYRTDVVLNVLSRWILAESYLGNCAEALNHFNSLTSESDLGAADVRVKAAIKTIQESPYWNAECQAIEQSGYTGSPKRFSAS